MTAGSAMTVDACAAGADGSTPLARVRELPETRRQAGPSCCSASTRSKPLPEPESTEAYLRSGFGTEDPVDLG